MKHTTTTGLLLGFALASFAGACTKKDTNVPGEGKACTEEAKVCPDGSSVGRTGPNCEFAECPAAADADKPDDAPADGEEKPAEEAAADNG